MSFRSSVASPTLVLLLVLMTGARAGAHAYVLTASPADGTSVPSPTEVKIRFTEGVELEFSTIVVKDGAGRVVSAEPVRQPAADTLAVDLRSAPPGAYTVEWRVLSVDTHITDGVLRFSVAGPARDGGRPR